MCACVGPPPSHRPLSSGAARRTETRLRRAAAPPRLPLSLPLPAKQTKAHCLLIASATCVCLFSVSLSPFTPIFLPRAGSPHAAAKAPDPGPFVTEPQRVDEHGVHRGRGPFHRGDTGHQSWTYGLLQVSADRWHVCPLRVKMWDSLHIWHLAVRDEEDAPASFSLLLELDLSLIPVGRSSLFGPGSWVMIHSDVELKGLTVDMSFLQLCSGSTLRAHLREDYMYFFWRPVKISPRNKTRLFWFSLCVQTDEGRMDCVLPNKVLSSLLLYSW